MQIQVFNIGGLDMPFIKYDDQADNGIVSVIARNTAQTWQPDRTARETTLNTKQGKLAEDIFQKFVRQSLCGINILSYDDIRNDNFTKHAPFDFLIWPDDNLTDIRCVVNAIQSDIGNSLSKFVIISDRTRKLCEEEGVKFVEVKSTKVAARHKPVASNVGDDYSDPSWLKRLAGKILCDDFLAYPSKCRSTSLENFNISDYAEILIKKGIPVGNYGDILSFETAHQLCDIFVRIYLDEPARAAFLVGWIDKYSFYKNAVLKKMPQFRKSELALYFAVPLMNRRNFADLKQFIED